MKEIVSQIECLKSKVLRWSVVHIFKEGNTMVDKLAKFGVHRSRDLVVAID
ncbi:hypothetical protein PTKIN_Ptkin05aG0121000 [Pterospermum kingtungense]